MVILEIGHYQKLRALLSAGRSSGLLHSVHSFPRRVPLSGLSEQVGTYWVYTPANYSGGPATELHRHSQLPAIRWIIGRKLVRTQPLIAAAERRLALLPADQSPRRVQLTHCPCLGPGHSPGPSPTRQETTTT